jgi:hypothetical protein
MASGDLGDIFRPTNCVQSISDESKDEFVPTLGPHFNTIQQNYQRKAIANPSPGLLDVKKKKYFCTSCNKGFTRKYNWKSHEMKDHELQEEYACPDCDIVVYSTTILKGHHENAHGCVSCDCARTCKRPLSPDKVRTAWGCGFCGALLDTWKRRCDHVARHYDAGAVLRNWSQTRVISGLLKQRDIQEEWDALLLQHLGQDPHVAFRWPRKSTQRSLGEPQLQDLLELGLRPRNPRGIAKLAHGLGLLHNMTTRKGSLSPSSLSAESDSLVSDSGDESEGEDNDSTLGDDESEGEDNGSTLGDAPSSLQMMATSLQTSLLSGPSMPEPRGDTLQVSGDSRPRHTGTAASTPSSPSADSASLPFSSDDGSEGENIDSTLDVLVDRFALTITSAIMEKIQLDDTTISLLRQCINGNSFHSSCPDGRSLASTITSLVTRSGKRSLDAGGGGDPNDDDGRQNKRPRKDITTYTKEEFENALRFACPYYKHNPFKYKDERTCSGPGWQNIHRVK